MEAPVQEQTITAEQFWEFCIGRDDRVELVEGRVRVMPPVGPEHAGSQIDLGALTRAFVREHRLGRVYGDGGFILRRNPDLTLGPDLAFVSAERMAANPPPPRGFWEIVPDLVVEIVSPGDTAAEIDEKVRDYLSAGVRLVWVVYPRTRRVHVYQSTGAVQIIFGEGVLEGGDVLPGFRLPLADLWE
jgi:Uma2 family endonuclease